MKTPHLFFLLLILIPSLSWGQKTKQEVIKSLDSHTDQYATTAHTIWEYAEVGFQETKSSALLQRMLTDAGFSVEPGVAGMPTAFVANYGQGKPVIE